MNSQLAPVASTTALIHAMLRALRPGEEVCLDSGLLKHFALTQQPDQPAEIHTTPSAGGAN